MAINLFSKICIETCSQCNRRCPTCLRQNDPTKSRMREGELPSDIVYNILNQAVKMNFKKPISLHFFNEPLMDPRIPDFASYGREKGLCIYLITNGDLLTPELAKQLDGELSFIGISLYDKADPAYESRRKHFLGLFKKTKVYLYGTHVTTHYSPRGTKEPISRFRNHICWNPQNRMVITYTGEMALCCEDIAWNWNLGNIKEKTLLELWYSPRHQKIVEVLNEPGGRLSYEYCKSCPRDGSFE